MNDIPMGNAVGHQRHGKPLKRLQSHLKISHFEFYNLNCSQLQTYGHEIILFPTFQRENFHGRPMKIRMNYKYQN